MSDLFIDSAQHGGQLGEGYGRAKTQGADFSQWDVLYLEKSVCGLIRFVR